MSPTDNAPYLMSFLTGGLFINESVAIACLHTPGTNWDATTRSARQSSAFPVRKQSSATRVIREITNRLRTLSDDEIALLIDGDRSEQASLLWLATCRSYRFIGEFAIEIVNERFLSMRTDLEYDDFDNFLSAKAEWSPKLASLAKSTKLKLRGVLFRIMKEAEIVTQKRKIIPSMLSTRIITMITADNSNDLRFFPGANN